MTSIRGVLLSLAVFVACYFGAVSCRPNGSKLRKDSVGEEPLGTAFDFTSKNGNRIIFPYFSNELKNINPQLREWIAEDTREIIEQIYTILADQLDKGHNPTACDTWRIARAGKKLMNTVSKQNDRRAPLLKAVKIEGDYNTYAVNVFDKLMTESDQLSKKSRKLHESLDHAKLKEDLKIFLNDMLDAVDSSPVATFIRFDQGTWNGKPFTEVSSEIIARLKTHGFGLILKTFGMILVIIKTFA